MGQWIALSFVGVFILGFMIWVFRYGEKKIKPLRNNGPPLTPVENAELNALIKKMGEQANQIDQIRRDTREDFSKLKSELDKVPGRTLNTIQGSCSNVSGRLGELVKYLELQATYDRIIILNDIADFLVVRLPKGDDPGELTFLDIKTGSGARLNADQRAMRDMINNHKELISFKVMKVELS